MNIRPGTRVKVHNGDGSIFLGEGEYVGDVKVYYIAMPDGSLRSFTNAEEPPPPDVLLETGGEVIESDGNPKLRLDSGLIVYGCQVWWEPVSVADRN